MLACRQARLLAGRIPSALLGELVLRAFRTSCREWAFAQLSIEEFRRTALTDVYITLAADAVDSFRAVLMQKIAALASASASSPNPHSRRSKEQV